MEQLCFNILGELKNIYVKIPLIQSIHGVPICANIVRDMVVKKIGKNPKDPPTMHVVGKLSELILGRAPIAKYDEPDNPIVSVTPWFLPHGIELHMM